MRLARLLLTAIALVGLVRPAVAEEAPALAPPEVANAPAMDGRLHEPVWEQAAVVPADAVTTPQPWGDAATRAMQPAVRALVSGGQLFIGVTCDEPPGTGCGLSVFVAPGDATSAGAADTLTYRPLNPRVAPLIARTGRGVGLAHWPAVGAIDVTQPDRWTLEMRVPLVDAVTDPNAPVRLALAVTTRLPTVVSAAPPGAKWRGPDKWFVCTAPKGGWRNEDVPSAEALADAARADAVFAEAWRAFLQATHQPPPITTVGLDTELATLAHAAIEARSGVAPVVHTMLGDLWERVGALDEARDAYAKALALAPGWREAHYGASVRLFARRLLTTPGPDGAPTDFAGAYARIEEARANAADWSAIGLDLAEGVLKFREGEMLEARPLLTRVSERFPGDAWPRKRMEATRTYEQQARAHRHQQIQGPRALIKTTRGDIVVVLAPEDVPNAVNQFVWLAEQGAYDGTRVHHTVPFSHAALGDPFSKSDDTMAKAGTGTPGYAVRLRDSKRLAFRGAIAFPLASTSERVTGSAFLLMTGFAVDPRQVVPFGRIIEGQDAADALRVGDRIKGIAISNKTPEWTYRPVGLDGKLAPTPK